MYIRSGCLFNFVAPNVRILRIHTCHSMFSQYYIVGGFIDDSFHNLLAEYIYLKVQTTNHFVYCFLLYVPTVNPRCVFHSKSYGILRITLHCISMVSVVLSNRDV
jgi:hypothetical protein